MSQLRVLYHIARADFLERTRRTSFLIMVGLVLYLGYLVNIGQITLRLETYRGVYNSAWVGSMMALVVNFLLGWFGFYLVKNAIARDYQTGVGQIMATTPLSRPLYLLGKWFSNMAVLDGMVLVLLLAALAMQLIQREDPQIQVWALAAPFVWVVLPFMALVAALAVLFESIAWLRGSFGNLVYFFLFILVITFVTIMFGTSVPVLDWLGFGVFKSSMAQAARAAYPDYGGGLALSMVPARGDIQPFLWAGVAWTLPVVLPRLAPVGLALLLVMGAALLFDRFEQTGMPRRKKTSMPGTDNAVLAAVGQAARPVSAAALAPLPAGPYRARFGRLFLAEWRMTVRGMPWWWYVAALGLCGAALLLPLDSVRSGVVPAALIWPLLVWSGLGCREARHAAGPLVFSAPHPLRNQLPMAWLAGFTVTALIGAGPAVRLGLAGEWSSLAAMGVGLLFIPSLALALGVSTGGSKAFEVVYALFWYLGVLNRVLELDYAGLYTTANWPVYLVLSFFLFAAALLGRKRQMMG